MECTHQLSSQSGMPRAGPSSGWAHDGLHQLLPRLVHLLGTAQRSGVRVAVLHAMTAVASLPYELLHSFKQPAVTSVKAALDDGKRCVRLAAVSCHGKWVAGG